MALAAGDLLEEARDAHPAFDVQQTPNKAALRHLSRLHDSLFQEAVGLDPYLVQRECEIDLPLEDFASGKAVPAALRYWLVTASFPTERRPVEVYITDHDHRLRPVKFPAVYFRGNCLYLAALEADWTRLGAHLLTVSYLPLATAITALTGTGSALELPDWARPVLVAGLAFFMAGRSRSTQGGVSVDMARFATDLAQARAEFRTTLIRRRKPVRSVWREA